MRTNLPVLSVAITILICVTLIQTSESVDIMAQKLFEETNIIKRAARAPSSYGYKYSRNLEKVLETFLADDMQHLIEKYLKRAISGNAKGFCIDLSKIPIVNMRYKGIARVELMQTENGVTFDVTYDGVLWRTFDLDEILEKCIPMPLPVSFLDVCVGGRIKNNQICAHFHAKLIDADYDIELWCLPLPVN